MSPPIRINSLGNGFYDDVNGVCYQDPVNYCEASSETVLTEPKVEAPLGEISRAVLLADAFGSPSRPLSRPTLWSDNPLQYSPLGFLPSLTACSSESDTVPVPGDPISGVSAVGGETSLSGSLHGKIRGVAVSSTGNHSSVLWSSFDGTHPAESGTFAYLRTGTSGGSLFPAILDTSALHLATSGAALENGETVAVYTVATGADEASSLVAQRISSSGALVGSPISVLPGAIRSTFPEGQVVPLSSGFVVVYQDGNGTLAAVRYDQNGAEAGRIADLGDTPELFRVTRGAGDSWSLAQIASGTSSIRVRSFGGIAPTGVDSSVNAAGFPSTPSLAVAMQDDGSLMLAYNVAGGGINGSLLSPAGTVQAENFRISSSGLANTVALASDHRGNFVLAWEQAGAILARIYNGTTDFLTPTGFSSISTGSRNSDIHASVSPDGTLSLVWNKSSDGASGEVLQDIMRRDFRISYAAE